MSYDVFTGALRMFDSFQDDKTEVETLFRSHPSLKELEKRFSFSQIAGIGDIFSRACRLLTWLAAHVYHKGDYDSRLTNAIDLLDYSLDKGPESGINCLSLSTALTEMCLSVGIFARRMSMMPLSPYDGDNHVVCEAWLPEEKRWVMLDPSYGGYLVDEAGRALSLLELRKLLGCQGEVGFSDGFHYNGDRNLDFEDVKEYYAKNLFYFKWLEVQTSDSDNVSGSRTLYLSPNGYDPVQSQFACIEYKEKRFGSHPFFDRRKITLRQEKAVFCGEAALTAAPHWSEDTA